LKVLIIHSLSVEAFLMFRQDCVIARLMFRFSQLDCGYSSVGECFPFAEGLGLVLSIVKREENNLEYL
jgi:hypothetical protein